MDIWQNDKSSKDQRQENAKLAQRCKMEYDEINNNPDSSKMPWEQN